MKSKLGKLHENLALKDEQTSYRQRQRASLAAQIILAVENAVGDSEENDGWHVGDTLYITEEGISPDSELARSIFVLPFLISAYAKKGGAFIKEE